MVEEWNPDKEALYKAVRSATIHTEPDVSLSDPAYEASCDEEDIQLIVSSPGNPSPDSSATSASENED